MNNIPVHAQTRVKRVATMVNLPDLLDALQDISSQAGLPEQDANDFRVAVEEACVNIIRYAYAGQAIGSIELDVVWSTDEGIPSIVCTLRDQGSRFNPLDRQLPDTRLAAEERSIGGLGVLLIRQMSDRVRWTYDGTLGNYLTLVKHIQPPNHSALLLT
jgi:serine/threonine-protein kinase RsbW